MNDAAVGTTAQLEETVLEFANNRLLVDLCGEFDRNLARIEDGLGLQIVRRGNVLALVGDADTRARASAILNDLYARLETGKPVESGDLDAALRMRPKTNPP
ncbi:MAG: phosphate starvation-inducible protein PhoH, partial [Planktomarina sp.]